MRYSSSINSTVESNLSEVINHGKQLLHTFYVDDQHHQLELRSIFEKGWMGIGFASEFARPGQSAAIEVLGKPILVTCDQHGKIRVFANVCRHRGHRLLTTDSCRGKLLTCPYHAWSYSLDGQLVSAPYWDGIENTGPPDSVKPELSLVPLRFAIWYDIVFVNFSEDATPLETTLSPLSERWENRPAKALQPFSAREFTMQGNWKLVAENFLDNYHLPWIHPEIGGIGEDSLGLSVANLQPGENILGFSHPTAGQSKGKTAAPLPAWHHLSSSEQSIQDLFFIFPNVCLVMEGYYLWSMILHPSSVSTTNEKLRLYLVDESALGAEYERSREELAKVINRINEQDAEVIRNLQLGRNHPAASQGAFCPTHDELGQWFHQMVARMLLASG